jgi:tetratricopeptide (TPR) repeat protein
MLPCAVLLVAALAPGAVSPAVFAQVGPNQFPPRGMALARQVVARAEELAEEGKTSEAIELVSEQLDRAAELDVEGFYAFALGWLLEDLSASEPERREALLREAAGAYRRSLDAVPENPRTLENLALVERDLGQIDKAIGLLQELTSGRDPDSQAARAARASRLLLLGDLLASKGELKSAYESYERALKLVPADEAAAYRVIGAYDSLGERWFPRLLQVCRDLGNAGLDEAARQGLETLVRRSSATGEGEPVAREALELWARIQARSGSLSPESFRGLPAEEAWNDPSLRELRGVVDAPLDPPGEIEYWTSTAERRHALALVLRARSLSLEREGKGAFAEAAGVYDRALAVAPPFHEYSAGKPLHGERMASLEVALELARLLAGHPELDPDGTRFRKLEDDLLGDKTLAYGESDLGAMEQFHTVLGLIYAGRGRWSDGDWRAAPYHLKRAVDTARRRAEREGRPVPAQPLPHLTRTLARGLESRERPDLEGARRAYLDAAEGFLEAGDRTQPRPLVDAARALNARLPTPPPAKLEVLEKALRQLPPDRPIPPRDVRRGGDR